MKTNKFDLHVYLIVAIVFILAFILAIKVPFFADFSAIIEGKTFDFRQEILSHSKKPLNNPVKIFALDTKTYEFINDTYGEWPVKREYWANLITEIEKYNPKLIVLDFMFPKKSKKGGDELFINAVNSNKNVVVGMLFDYEEEENRISAELPKNLKNEVKNDNLIKENPRLVFPNSQPILFDILNNSKNIGSVNFTRESDGIIRYMPVLVNYKDDYYKNISFVSALNYLDINKTSFEIKNGKLLLDNGFSIPLNDSGRAIMNWYNEDTFENVSLSDVHKAINDGNEEFLIDKIQDKVIYIGATASLLNDIKSSPILSMVPGVEIHATFFENVINNDFVYHVPVWIDLLIAVLLSVFAVFLVNRIQNIVVSFGATALITVSYLILSIFLMGKFNIWIGIIFPLLSAATFFVTAYILKYILKSRDYEHTYKLAVTDVMTQLYNHRYFQEQMVAQTQNYNRYQTSFSLIMSDIDFFKKFNDTYGHQSGDAVLKQVAQIMKSCVRSTDIPCRYGGEKMAVILTNTNNEDAITTANKICEAVRNTKVTLATGDIVNVTISVGVATMPKDGLEPKELIEACDKRLYKAKENGRNQVVSD